MLATFLIEAFLAIFIWLAFPRSKFLSLSVVILLCLASFQVAEYQVCGSSASNLLSWTKLGLVGISFLPALGMHLIGAVTRKSVLIPIGYILAAGYAILFVFVPGATSEAACFGNYVMLHITQGWIGWIYELYYSTFVILAIVELTHRLMGPDSSPRGYSSKLIAMVLVGYLSFTVPMALIDLAVPQLRPATPSFMCGFAVLLAVTLSVFAVPLYSREKRLMDTLSNAQP
jgi:hypothetical protein